MKQNLIPITLLLTIFLTPLLNAQSVEKNIDKYIAADVAGTVLPDISFMKNEAKTIKALQYLKTYYTDTSNAAVSAAYHLTSIAGQHAENEEIHKQVVAQLVQGLGSNFSNVEYYIINALKNYKPSDFSLENRELLAKHLLSCTSHFNSMVKLAGYLQLTEVKDYLKSIAAEDKINEDKLWPAQFALGRMGEKKELGLCVLTISKMLVNDNTILNYYPDLAYLRHKQSVDVMVKVVMSNKKNCMPANPYHTGKILCGYRLLEYLAPIIVDFPLKLAPSGQIETDDYDKALKTARKWLKEHENNYKLIYDVY